MTLKNNNSSDFSIHIDNVQVSDEGPYTCSFQANNKPGVSYVYLIVQGKKMKEGGCVKTAICFCIYMI